MYSMTRQVLENDLYDWILECASQNPGFWLPVEERCFVKMKAKRVHGGHDWMGILPGGHLVPLPQTFVEAKYTTVFPECILAASKGDDTPPVDCALVGLAASSSGRGDATASATVGVASSNRFVGCVEDNCIAYSTAVAIDLVGRKLVRAPEDAS